MQESVWIHIQNCIKVEWNKNPGEMGTFKIYSHDRFIMPHNQNLRYSAEFFIVTEFLYSAQPNNYNYTCSYNSLYLFFSSEICDKNQIQKKFEGRNSKPYVKVH